MTNIRRSRRASCPAARAGEWIEKGTPPAAPPVEVSALGPPLVPQAYAAAVAAAVKENVEKGYILATDGEEIRRRAAHWKPGGR